MKEIEKFKISPKIEKVAQAEQEYRLELDEQITPHKGHNLYKVNLKSGEIEEAVYSHDLIWDIKQAKFVPENSTLIKEKGYTYVSALNKSNVEKKLHRLDNGSRIDHSKDFLDL